MTAQIIYSTLHACHEVLAWSRTTLCGAHIWVWPKKWWHSCCIMAVSAGSTARGENIECLLLWLLHQPEENKRVCSPYGSSRLLPASQLTPLPTLGSANSAHSEIQWDSWHHEQDQWYSSPPGSSVHGIPQAKNIGVSCHSLLQDIFLTQGSNPYLLCLLHCRWILLSESSGKHR